MKRFVAKILVFILIVGTISTCINFVYMKRDNSDPEDIRKFRDIPSSIMLCNFGSSHGLYGFNYEDVNGVECFNFALSSQSLSYDKRLFDYYKDNIAEGAVVFIPVSYFSLYGNPEVTDDDFLSKNKRYYQILPPKLIKEFDLKTDIYEHFPSVSKGVGMIEMLLAGSDDTEEDIWSTVASDEYIRDDAKRASERHVIKNKLDENGNRILNQEELGALKYLINSCYENGYIPILITVPFPSEYTDEIKKKDPEFFEDFYQQIDDIVAETGVRYYDYGFDSRFVSEHEWFMNSDHLNKEGARQFVNILMDEVIHYGTEESLIK